MTDDRRGTLQLIGVACLIVFALFLTLSIPLFWGQIRILRSWPVRQAVVVHSAVVSEPSGRHGQVYSAHIEIAYVVGGKAITTELTSFQSSNYAQTVRRAEEFPAGSRYVIRYDPNDPKLARIDASWNRRFFALPLITLGCGAVFGLLAGGLFIAAHRFQAPRDAILPPSAS
ncbi:MAG TPA: DUF3592 domain-containing protein [Bryocella sp.]|nr:DUF3592 domain-containing protein [Bryocella sp.]